VAARGLAPSMAATTTMEHMQAYPESPLDPDEAAYPCKGCGEVLEEGKAFELGKLHNRLTESALTDHASWKSVAHRLLPLQHLQDPPRLGRKPALTGRWLTDMQQLHL